MWALISLIIFIMAVFSEAEPIVVVTLLIASGTFAIASAVSNKS